ncbi:MAG: hypothetical protein ACRDTH_14505 [Pseudonocardiaceae bacterium]
MGAKSQPVTRAEHLAWLRPHDAEALLIIFVSYLGRFAFWRIAGLVAHNDPSAWTGTLAVSKPFV